MRVAVYSVLLLCVFTVLIQGQNNFNSSLVNVPGLGQIQGSQAYYSNVDRYVNSFVGIPYAAAPIGDLRFAYPQAAAAFTGAFDATRFGNICPQPLNGQFSFPNQNLSEDCLNLNIWAPATPGLKPVVFWMHAGAFLQGSGSELRYHGNNLAAQEDIVVVTINYRLGALGSLAHPSLYATYGYTGDYTLADQAFALNWVYENIQYFGGDNSMITVGGISAGGAATTYLMANPNTKPQIHQAIVQSGDPLSQAQSMAQGLTQGVQTASLVACNGTDAEIIACLRNVSFNTYINLATYGSISKVSVGAGQFLADSPYNFITKNYTESIPVFVGNSLDEFDLFVYTGQTAPLSQMAYAPFLANLLSAFTSGVNAFSVVNTYPCAAYNPSDCREAASTAFSDSGTFCQVALFAENAADYGYLFSYRPSYENPIVPGAPHLSDIPFNFNSLNLTTFAFNAADQAVADVVSRYFGSFIRTGNPNYAGQPTQFPNYQSAGNPRIDYAGTIPSVVTGFKTLDNTPACGYWATVYGQLAAAEMIMMASNSSAIGMPAPAPSCSPCPVATSSPCPVLIASGTPIPTPTYSCPAQTPTASPTPSCSTPPPSCAGQENDDNDVNINFYFADMLRH